MEVSLIDDLSDAVSVLSQDRMSDDTDFLIGHNISFSCMNDSYIDAKSSTTTDIIYQQELYNTDVILSTSRGKSNSGLGQKATDEAQFATETDIKNYTNRIEASFGTFANREKGSHGNFESENEIRMVEKIDDIEYQRKEMAHYSDSKDKILNDEQIKVRDSSNEISKSLEDVMSNQDPIMSTITNNWKYRSVHDSSDEDFSVGKDGITKASDTFSDSFAEYDPKVREGEELLARLLGRVTLTESFKSKTHKAKDAHQQNQDATGKESTRPDVSGSRAIIKNSSSQPTKDKKEGDRPHSNWRASKVLENRPRSDLTSPYSDRSQQSKSSGASMHRRSSNDLVESQSISSHKYSNKVLSYEELNPSHVDMGSSSNRELESMGRNASEGSIRRQPDSSRRSSGSSSHGKSSTSASDKKRESSGSIRVEQTNEYLKGLTVYQNHDNEYLDRKRSSSLEKQRQKINLNAIDAELATSTPQRTNWPLSPIKKAVDPKLEESEALVVKYERKLKELQLLVEQEMLRKEAILDEKSTAEEGLTQVKKNILSLEQLAEDHKKQIVSTRTELMELERKRDDCQRVLIQVTEDLRKQKKELESLPEELKESNISTKIALLQDERDDLKRECKILMEKCKDNDLINSKNVELMNKVRTLQEQFYNEQDSNHEKLKKLRGELENERRKAVEANIEQMSTLRKIREEAMDAKKMELDAAIEKMEKEKEIELESIRERYNRELKSLQRKIEEHEEESQRVTKLNNERVGKLQEQSNNNHRREMENAIKRFNNDKQNEMAIVAQRHKRETEELKLEMMSKAAEIENLQALLKQQAESTRLLGEKLRSEAKEQICLAVEKERDTRLEELRKTELELEKVKGERDSLSSESNSELINKEGENERLRNIISKLKKELDESRQETYEAREERIQAISKARSTMREDVDKLKMKLREMEKFEQMTLIELNEEFMKTATVTGGSYPQIKKNYSFDADDTNAISEALNTLKVCNNDLRKLAMTYKRRSEEPRKSDDSCNQSQISEHDINMDRSQTLNRSRTPERSHTPETARTPDRLRTPDGLVATLNGSNEESRSARILKHLQSRVRQLREGNESMRRSFGSDEGDNDADITSRSNTPERIVDATFSNSSAETKRLESALKNAEEQVQKYAGLLNQKMSENTKLQKMLTQASKENIKLERLHSILQHKVATSGVSI